jgi:hypothetical protein
LVVLRHGPQDAAVVACLNHQRLAVAKLQQKTKIDTDPDPDTQRTQRTFQTSDTGAHNCLCLCAGDRPPENARSYERLCMASKLETQENNTAATIKLLACQACLSCHRAHTCPGRARICVSPAKGVRDPTRRMRLLMSQSRPLKFNSLAGHGFSLAGLLKCSFHVWTRLQWRMLHLWALCFHKTCVLLLLLLAAIFVALGVPTGVRSAL